MSKIFNYFTLLCSKIQVIEENGIKFFIPKEKVQELVICFRLLLNILNQYDALIFEKDGSTTECW